MVPSRDGNRIQVTSEREPGRLLASGLQQIKKFLAQRGADEDDSDELAAEVLQYLTSVFHGAHPQSSMSFRNSRELRTIAEIIDSLLADDLPHLEELLMQRLKSGSNDRQWLELIPATGSYVVTPVEMRAAQRLQLDQLRLQQGGKGNGGVPVRTTKGTRSGRRNGVAFSLEATLKSDRKGRGRVSHRFHRKVRSTVSASTPKSPPPLQKVRSRSSPARAPPQLHVGTFRAASQSPSMAPSPLPSRQVALRGLVPESQTDKMVSFRKIEERKTFQNRTP